jgi:hypothetical protein
MMKFNFNLFLILFSLLILIQGVYSLECSAGGMVTGVEISLDDNSFSSDFDGTSGIIYKLDFNPLLGKYDLWQTNNLATRSDMGNNIVYSTAGLNPATHLIDSSELGEVLRIDTSLYENIYVKEISKNTGSCDAYSYQLLKHYSRMIDIGGTTTNFYISDFGSRMITMNVNSENTQYYSMNIKDYYSGDFRVRSWIRKGSTPYSPTFQLFEVKLWFDGGSLDIPTVTRLDSYSHNPIIEGNSYFTRYQFHNPSPTEDKNVSLKLQTWSGDANPHLNIYSHYMENEIIDKITLAPLETRVYQYDYIIPLELDEIGLNSYRAAEYIRFVDDPILGSQYLIRSWPKIGSLDHSYLAPDIQKETFVQGTTNDGIPYVGTDYLLKEYNLWYPHTVEAGDYDYEILLSKKNATSSWNNFYTDRTTFNEHLNNNQNKRQSFVYPLYDFENWVGESVKFDIQSYWNTKNWRFFYDTTSRGNFDIDLDFSHLLMSTDLPLYFYPNLGSDELYIRDVLFNLKDYKLRDVSISTKILDPISGVENSNFIVTAPSNFDVPAKASYPIPISIKYTGPVVNEKYILIINYSYYDEINGVNVSKMLYGDIYVKSDLVVGNYYDLIVKRINYDDLYLGKNSNVEVVFENQGNAPISSSHRVSLYYKNLTESIFHLIDSKIALSTDSNVIFNYIPLDTGSQILKVVIDEDDDINENSIYSVYGEENNGLASISFVRDIDVVLDFARPLYDQVVDEGVIPFEIRIHNAGVGGIDEFDVDLNISWKNDYWYFNDTYYNIPEEGRTFMYYWNVTDVTPGVHVYNARALPLYDTDYSNNIKSGAMDFCPLPWYSSPIDCFSNCDYTCIDKFNLRYKPSCDGVNGCDYFNEDFALSCGGYTKDSFADFNETHTALCPDASIVLSKRITNQSIDIRGNCTDIFLQKSPVLLDGESVLMNLITCTH